MADWMGRLPDAVKKKPISELAIPGSHDSGAHWFNMRLGYAHDQSFLRYLRHFSFRFIKRIVKRWGLTQSLSIEEQLMAGIRFLDLRLEVALDTRVMMQPMATEDSNDDSSRKSCFIVHGLFSTDWLKLMSQILKFLEAHKEEVLIINVSHIYRMTNDEFKRFFLDPLAIHASRSGIKLCDTHEDMRTVTLEQLIAKNYRIIVVGPAEEDIDFISYRASTLQNKWPNKNNTSEIIKFVQAQIHSPVSPGLRVMQGVVTPKLSDIFRNLRGSLRTVFSLTMRSLLKIWVRRLNQEEIGNLNILISDQVDNEFCRLVYYLNVSDCPEHRLDQYFSNPHLDGYDPQAPVSLIENILFPTPPSSGHLDKSVIYNMGNIKETGREIVVPETVPNPIPDPVADSVPQVIEDVPIVEQIMSVLEEDQASEPEIHIEEIFGDFDVESSSYQPRMPHLRSVMVQQIEMVLDDTSSESTSTLPHSPIPPPKPKRASQRIPIVLEVVPLPDDVPSTRAATVSFCRSSGTPVRIAPPVTEEELRLAAAGEYHTYSSIYSQRLRAESSRHETIVVARDEDEDDEFTDESTPLVSHEIENMVEDLVINSTIDAMDNLADRFKSL